MKVAEVMTRNPICCTPQTTLGAAAVLMAEAGCGTLPVVANGRTVGMITDRDICVALAAGQCLPSDLPVADVMSEALYACREQDDLQGALQTMRDHRVRRLPVLDGDGALTGLLSIDDVLASAGDAGDGSLSETEAVQAFQRISRRPERPVPVLPVPARR